MEFRDANKALRLVFRSPRAIRNEILAFLDQPQLFEICYLHGTLKNFFCPVCCTYPSGFCFIHGVPESECKGSGCYTIMTSTKQLEQDMDKLGRRCRCKRCVIGNTKGGPPILIGDARWNCGDVVWHRDIFYDIVLFDFIDAHLVQQGHLLNTQPSPFQRGRNSALVYRDLYFCPPPEAAQADTSYGDASEWEWERWNLGDV